MVTLLCSPVIITNIENTSNEQSSSGNALRGSSAACFLVVIALRMSTSLDMLTMAAIAVVRYVGIGMSRPAALSTSRLSWSRCAKCVVAIWIYTVFWTGLGFIPGLATFAYSGRMYVCVLSMSNAIFFTVNVMLVYFPCVVVLVASYVGIYSAVRRARLRLDKMAVSTTGARHAASKVQENRRVTRETHLAVQLGVIVGVFITCWTPYLVTNAAGYTDRVPVWLSNIFIVSIQVNAAINPIVYLCYNRVYRQELRRIVFCCFPSPKVAVMMSPPVPETGVRLPAPGVATRPRVQVDVQREMRLDSLTSTDLEGNRPVAMGIAGALPAVSAMVAMMPPSNSCTVHSYADVESGSLEMEPPHHSHSINVTTSRHRLQRQQHQTFDEIPSTTLFAAYSC